MGLAGALMDGVMVRFTNAGCTDYESDTADTGECVSAAEAAASGGTLVVGTIDRSGYDATRTPDWKFVGDVRYVMPVLDTYELTFIGKGYVSDGFITDRSGFSYISKFNQHGDLNLQVALGPQDGKWKVSTYANNIFEARESYNPEYDVVPSGLATAQVTRSNFMTYGLKFNYNFGE